MKKQNVALLEYLKRHQTISPLEALELLGIFRLAARIKDLRDAGHDIHTSIVTRHEKHFARYRLIKAARSVRV